MADEQLDLEMVQNETFRREFTFADDGTPGSFAGCVIRAQVREKEDVASNLLLDLGPYFTVSEDGATATLRVPATVTAALSASPFRRPDENEVTGAYWDMFLVDANDPEEAELFTEGRARMNPAATVTAVTA